MWTSTLNLKLNRVLLTRLLSRVYPDIYGSSLSPVHVANIPRPALPAASWVRVRNRLAGICSSDLHLIHTMPDMRTSVAAFPNYKPIYPGHEVVGEVIEIGEDVQHLRVGDRVVLQYSPNCLSSGVNPVCRACTAGNYNLCEYGSLPDPQPIGGGWSEEMLLHEQQLFRLPTELSNEQGVTLEPGAVALHAVLRHLPQANDNVLVIGAGTMGLLTLQILHTLAPKAHISMLADYPFEIERATRLGANHIIYPADPYASVQRATHARLYKGIFGNRTLIGGYDVIYDTVGEQKTLHHALRWLRAQGTMVLVDLSLQMMDIDLTPIWHQEINLLGSFSHGREITWPGEALTDLAGTPSDLSTFSIVVELMRQKRIQPEQLITHRFGLNNYKDALIAAKQKKNSQSIKVLFDHALLPASAVPNARASAHPYQPALSQPQGDAFREEFLQAENRTSPRQKREQETIPQSNMAEAFVLPKIVDTPPPQVLPKGAWQAALNRQDSDQDETDEDTDPAIPAIKRPPYHPHDSSELPVISPPLEATPAFIVEAPETKTDVSEVNSISAQPTLEAQQDQVADEFPPSTGHIVLEAAAEVAVELPVHEEEPTSPFPETVGMNTLTEEQLPTQTILDNLDADTSSMPEFLAQLSNFGEPTRPEIPVENREAPDLPEIPVENREAPSLPDASVATLPKDAPDEEKTEINPTSSTLKVRKRRKAAKSAQTDTTFNVDGQQEKKQVEGVQPEQGATRVKEEQVVSNGGEKTE